MVKKGIKLITIILILLFFINVMLINNNVVYASTITDVTEWDGWEPTLKDSSVLNDMVGPILGTIRIIGILISVGTISFIGIRTMIGSVEEKAAYKKSLIPWTLGAVMVFAISYIPGMIYDITNNIGTTVSEQQDEQTKVSKLEGFDDAIEKLFDLISENEVNFTNADSNEKLTILSNIRKSLSNAMISHTSRNHYYVDGFKTRG